MKELDLSRLRSSFEEALDQCVKQTETPIEMLKPMLYSLKGGGKRVRPLLLLATLWIQQPKLVKSGMNTAIALEYIHTYALIHDDLPAMDNDELRRGMPTSHIQFDEATAILAGDALLTDAFGIIANDKNIRPKLRAKLISALSKASGSMGMVAGQLNDVKAESQDITLEKLQRIHSLKTGCLFNFAVEAAMIIAGLEGEKKHFFTFSEAFGTAYQIHNDLMDVSGTVELTGKAVGQDKNLNKATYPALLGVEGSYAALGEQIDIAEKALQNLNKKTGRPYHQLIVFLDYLNIEREAEAEHDQEKRTS